MFQPLLQPWVWRLDVLLVLMSGGVTYTLGWWRLRRLTQTPRLAQTWRLACYWLGLLSIALALLSPIDALSTQLFFMHMLQHLLLVMIAPPLLLLANPFPFVMWGLPHPWRRPVGSFFQAQGLLRRGLHRLAWPGLALLIFVAVLWGWHYPPAYDAALRNETIHDLEHLTFFITALLYWWRVIPAKPSLFPPTALESRIAFLLFTVPWNMLLGVWLTFASQPVYPHYTTVPRLWGLSVLQDQMFGGVIMWVPGSMMYVVAAVVLVWQILQRDDVDDDSRL